MRYKGQGEISVQHTHKTPRVQKMKVLNDQEEDLLDLQDQPTGPRASGARGQARTLAREEERKIAHHNWFL